MWLPLAIIALVFSFVLIIIKLSMEHEKEKLLLNKGKEGDAADKSLTVSELNEMIEEAIEKAIAPLNERLDRLETEEPDRERPLLTDAPRRLDLDDLDLENPDDELFASRRRRVH